MSQTAISRKRGKIDLNPVHHKYIDAKDIKVASDSRTVSGYLSVFNVVDSDGDYIVRGAFAKSITERGPDSSTNRKIAFLWQHDMKDPIGRMTVLKEDNIGLYFEAVLDEGEAVPNAERALVQLKSGSINQFSIGYQYVWDKMEYDEDLDAFVCKEINLFEGSVVTLGANEFTFFDGMKSGQLKDIKQKLIKETEAFIKQIPAQLQYECRLLIMKNIQLAGAKTKADADNDNDNDAGGDDSDADTNIDFIHKNIADVHAKGLSMIDQYQGAVDNTDLTDCMNDMQDMHTECMTKMLNIKAAIKGEKSLNKPRKKALAEPITDLHAVLQETNFFTA